MDYQKKYHKYIKEYKKLKLADKYQYGGNGGDMSFFERSGDFNVPLNYEILFNMYLVDQEIRHSFLLELSDFSKYDRQKIEQIEFLKNIYNEFNYTVEHKIDNVPHRVFIHKHDLLNKTDNEDHDDWVARNLGFYCIGIPKNNILRKSIEYNLIVDDGVNLENNTFSFYTEICKGDGYDPDYHNEQLEKFKIAAKELNETWNVEKVITDLMQNEADYFINLLLNNEINENNFNLLLNMLGGDGIIHIETNIDNGLYSMNELIDNKNLLMFSLMRTKHEPFEILFPLSKRLYKFIQSLEEYYYDLETDPIDSFTKIERNLLMKLNETEKMETYHATVDNLIDEYEKLIH
jgi:hypothetical protein